MEHPNMERCQPWGTEDEYEEHIFEKLGRSQSHADCMVAYPTCGFVPTHLITPDLTAGSIPTVTDVINVLEMSALVDQWAHNLDLME